MTGALNPVIPTHFKWESRGVAHMERILCLLKSITFQTIFPHYSARKKMRRISPAEPPVFPVGKNIRSGPEAYLAIPGRISTFPQSYVEHPTTSRLAD